MSSNARVIANSTRRDFLKSAATVSAVALTIGFEWGGPSRRAFAGAAPPGAVAPFAPNAFLRIGADNSVTVIAKHVEMGQGAYTGLATIVAEELDADWTLVRLALLEDDVLHLRGLPGRPGPAHARPWPGRPELPPVRASPRYAGLPGAALPARRPSWQVRGHAGPASQACLTRCIPGLRNVIDVANTLKERKIVAWAGGV